MKFNVFDLYNYKTMKRVKCAIVTTKNGYILITIMNEKTRIREYKRKRELLKELMILKKQKHL